jgi:hypothetical protein
MNEQIVNLPSSGSRFNVEKPGKALALAVIIYLAFCILLPLPRFDFELINRPTRALLVIVPTLAFMLLQLWLSISIVHLRLRSWQNALLSLVTFVVWVIVLLFVHPTLSMPHFVRLLTVVNRFALLGAALTFCLTCLGSLLSLIIREKNILLPVALIAMPIDYLGAMTPTGFTHDMVMHASKIVSNVSVSVPQVTVHGFSISPIAYIGPGDVLFMALFFAAVQRFDLSERKTFWWMYSLLSISMLLVVRLSNFPIGALVPMGLAVIIANIRAIKLKRDEVFAVAYAGALILVLVIVFFTLSHRFLFHAHR